MKVVINKCFGGFGLSHKAQELGMTHDEHVQRFLDMVSDSQPLIVSPKVKLAHLYDGIWHIEWKTVEWLQDQSLSYLDKYVRMI